MPSSIEDGIDHPPCLAPKMAEWLHSRSVETHIEALMADFHVPGLAVAIVVGHKVYSRGFGQACLNPPQACTPDTLFDVASLSKPLTAVGVALLRQESTGDCIFQWDTPMAALLRDDFVMSDPEATTNITVEDVLSHRTGLPGHGDSIRGINAEDADDARSVVRNLRNLPLSKPTRSTYQYSNIMYTAATHLIETLSQESFSRFLRGRLFDKLGMASTFLQPSEVIAADQQHRFSTPYLHKHGVYHATCHQERPEGQGSGSIQTSVNDLAKFIGAIVNRVGPITDDVYIAITTPRIMMRAGADMSEFGPESTETAYALGWDVRYYHRARIVSHDGLVSGYGSRMFFVPHLRLGAIISGNSDGAFHLSAVVQHELIDQALDLPDARPFASANRRLKRFISQKTRAEKNAKRNAERRVQARSTLSLPLPAYFGTFHNAGYRSITISGKDGDLFIDGRERSLPFTMLLEHVSENLQFRGYFIEDDASEGIVQVSFRKDDDAGRGIVAVGIAFERVLDDLIWFRRV